MEAQIDHPSIANNAVPSAPYTRHAPSPPFIPIPSHSLYGPEPVPGMMPSYENVDSSQLTARDVEIITQNATQIATDRATDWSYEQRRDAQQVLDFLYLGPTSVVRNHEFLQKEGITMIVVAKDARIARKPASVEKAAEALGLDVHYVDIESYDNLISTFPATIRAVNDHLLAIYHSQAQGKNQDGNLVMDPNTFRRGKVLIACETGNDRAANIVAAYIMAVFGKDMVTTVQFISIQRFCCCFDEDAKRKLQSWEDILRARSQVASEAATPQTTMHSKRQIDQVMGTDENFDVQDGFRLDQERFEGRDPFVPFVDM
ncbi:hypothetical protein ACHAPJ_009212 [Fusarium lateritium]